MRYLTLIAVLCVACGDGESDGSRSDDWGSTAATPQAAVEAFIDAAASKDVKALGKLFSSKCEREFKKIVDGSVSDKDMEGLAKMFKDATITATKVMVNEDTATVDVKLPNHERGNETLNLVKENGTWRIIGF